MAMLSSELALLLLLPRSESDTDGALALLQSRGAPSCELRLLGVVGRLVRLSLDGECCFLLLRRLQAGSTSDDRLLPVGATLFRRAATATGCEAVVVADQAVPALRGRPPPPPADVGVVGELAPEDDGAPKSW